MIWANRNASAVTVPTTSETEIARVTCSGARAGQSLIVTGEFHLSVGTGTTGVTIRIRRTSLTGTVEFSVAVAATGGSTQSFFADVPVNAFADDPTYLVTVQQTAATGGGTVLAGNGFIQAQTL